MPVAGVLRQSHTRDYWRPHIPRNPQPATRNPTLSPEATYCHFTLRARKWQHPRSKWAWTCTHSVRRFSPAFPSTASVFTPPSPQKSTCIRLLPLLASRSSGQTPPTRLILSYGVEFNPPQIGLQSFHLDSPRDNFLRKIAPARTFGFVRDLDRLRAAGLARVGSIDNALVLDDEALLNGPLRFRDEY